MTTTRQLTMKRSADHGPPRRFSSARRRFARPGTIMVFVLGVLTLLALVGLVLITRTHGEARRVNLEASASTSRGVMNLAVRTVQEILRRDIWGPNPNIDTVNTPPIFFPRPLDSNGTGMAGENNEPYDAPGAADRWLASTSPHLMLDLTLGSPTYGQPLVRATYTGVPPGGGYPPGEDGILKWPHVSYVGGDLLSARHGPLGIDPYVWPVSSRLSPQPAAPASAPVFYSTASLDGIEVLQTPPQPYYGFDLIPGSTTNRTIAEARAAWEAEVAARISTLQALLVAGATPAFPYFDTNADGQLDLYDADGDGVPDSPLSLVIPVESADPNRPRNLYAAVRIVDHGSMVNVNAASAFLQPNGALTFDETLAGLQRRGRRQTELVVDESLHANDQGLQAANMVAYRDNNAAPDPVGYDADVVRRVLAGGTLAGATYRSYGVGEEAALRYRGTLVPYDRRLETLYTDFGTLDRALPATLQWSRFLNGYAYDVDASAGKLPRWARMNANWGSPNYEGFDDVNGVGWRHLFREDEPFALRRQMLTTLSREVAVPADLVSPRVFPLKASVVANESALDHRVRELWARGMDWPVFIAQGSALANDPLRPSNTFSDRFVVPPEQMPPEWARTLPIDLNMRAINSNTTNVVDAKVSFIRYLAAAAYLSLPRDDASSLPGCPPVNEGELQMFEGAYQGQVCDDHPCGPADESINAEFLAWQFAANVADYRDNDNVPTIINATGSALTPWSATWPQLRVFGVEKQPFFTEAFAQLTVGSGAGSGPSSGSTIGGGDVWFFAVELYVPPLWDIPTGNLYIRAPNVPGSGVSTMWPLSSFTRIFGGQSPTLSGGVTGQYIVLCGSTTGIPSSLAGASQGYYRNPAFRLAVDAAGDGEVELVWSPTGIDTDPDSHVLDVMRPVETLDSSSSNDVKFGGDAVGQWAKNPGALPPGTRRQFSMLRSTKGWRFTTAYQVYSEAPSSGSGGQPFRQSLGAANNTSGNLDVILPESVWPARSPVNGNYPPDPFGPDAPFATFDSAAELSRMLTIGPVRWAAPPPPPWLSPNTSGQPPYFIFHQPGGQPGLPATSFLTEILSTLGGKSPDLPDGPMNRPMAGRIDFDRAAPGLSGKPWTWALAKLVTTQDMLFDGIDNDGDGVFDLFDMTENYDVLHRVAGRININTAPATVLRSVPYMSMLPNSVEFLGRGLGSGDPAADFVSVANAGRFWDLAGAIVSARDNRQVALRLPDSTGAMLGPLAVATADPNYRPDYAVGGAFQSVMELAMLDRHIDASALANDSLFRFDRFTFRPNDPSLMTYNHKTLAADPDLGAVDLTSVPAGAGNRLSPDFRFRRSDNNFNGNFNLGEGDDFVADYVPLTAVESGGLRGRDVLLTRWQHLLTVRSDVYTAYIAILDENGNYVSRSEVTLDRTDCFGSPPGRGATESLMDQGTLPHVVTRTDGPYAEAVD